MTHRILSLSSFSVLILASALLEAQVAADSGTPIPNVTDGFNGSAPDLGALESGAEAPHYGPRP